MDRDWTEIIVKLKTEHVEAGSDIAQMAASNGIYIEDYSTVAEDVKSISHIDMIEDELLNKDTTHAIIHIYISPEENPEDAVIFLTERFLSENIDCSISQNIVNEDDWANNWKKYFKPIEVGERLTIKPEWEEYENSGRVILEINPGVAFGTGTHETTQLCLTSLEKYILPDCNKTVLDIGCGSGILSIASLLFGASQATGVDIDPLATKIAVENGMLNGFKNPEYNIITGNLTEKVIGQFDIVVANIVADVIIGLAEYVSRYINENGLFIVSGIIDDRINDVKEALEKNNFKVISVEQQNVWAVIVAAA